MSDITKGFFLHANNQPGFFLHFFADAAELNFVGDNLRTAVGVDYYEVLAGCNSLSVGVNVNTWDISVVILDDE